MTNRGVALLFTLLWAQLALADNWPQWRGPGSSAISAETNLPVRWSTDDNIAWQVELAGYGVSSPVVWGDYVFVTSQVGSTPQRGGSFPQLARADPNLARRENPIRGDDRGGQVFFVVEAFRQSDGQRAWEFRARAAGRYPPLHEKHNLATPTPVVDGERVYAWFGNGQVFALNFDGELLWQRHLGEERKPWTNDWGHGSSPTLHDGKLILLVDHRDEAYIIAFDAETGEQEWFVDRGANRVSHSTPVIVPHEAGDEMVVVSNRRVDAFDPRNGRPLWHLGVERQTPIPTPVHHNGLLYLARGYRNSEFYAIKPGGRGNIADTEHILWRYPRGGSYAQSLLYYDGLVYVTNDVGVVLCADAETGERVWQHRLDGIFFASPVAGDGKIYMASETGETYVLKPGREPIVIATNDIGDERLIASPAIAGGKIYLRSDGKLFAVAD
jgi:hypothetical protein